MDIVAMSIMQLLRTSLISLEKRSPCIKGSAWAWNVSISIDEDMDKEEGVVIVWLYCEKSLI